MCGQEYGLPRIWGWENCSLRESMLLFFLFFFYVAVVFVNTASAIAVCC